MHKLLSDQIQSLGLGGFYEVQVATIKGKNGTEIVFSGLSDQTSESIKSFEGIDICWVEEAQAVTDRSWEILTPTIRKDDSEIWLSFNPELDTDPTWVRFVLNPPPDSWVCRINYSDNPWHGEVLEAERLHAKATLPADDYENIWEGRCRAAVSGAIYAAEVAGAQERITSIPYDPAFKVHVIFDLGWNDSTSIIMVQRHMSEVRVIDYIEDRQKTLDWYNTELRTRRYNWGSLWLPHDGDHKDYKSGKSGKEIMSALGWDVQIVDKIDVEGGIRAARMMFPRVWFDKAKTARLLECLRRYRRSIPKTTGEPSRPVHDEYSHGADAFRYMAVCEQRLTNETWNEKVTYPELALA